MTTSAGRLAIWNKCAPGKQAEYEAWYQTEHLHERLSIPGFRRARRYEAISRSDGYFTYYETDTPDVLTSDAYLQRVNNPTPMTARIMRGAFTDMSRTVCCCALVYGRMRGVFAATLQMPHLPPEEWLCDWAGSEGRVASIARIEGWQAIGDAVPESTEIRLRGGDDQIEACLFVETLRETECLSALDHLAAELDISVERTGVYRLLCELTDCPGG